MTPNLYHINRYGVLRVDFILAVILIFFVRHWWMSLAVMMSRSPELMNEFFHGNIWKAQLVAEIPALLAAIAALRRKPTGGVIIRLLWRLSPLLITIAGIGSAAFLFAAPGWRFGLENLDELRFLQLVFTLGALGYVFGVAHVRKSFAEFPAPPSPAEGM